jgi:hypothetical protein
MEPIKSELRCYATNCKNNSDGTCVFFDIVIDSDGSCREYGLIEED